jgi:hypothetical protein
MTDTGVQHPTILKMASGQIYHSFHREEMGRVFFRSNRNDAFRPISYPHDTDSTLYVPVGRLQDVSSSTDTEAAKELYPCFSPLPDGHDPVGIPMFQECAVPAVFMPIKIHMPLKAVRITSEGSLYFKETSTGGQPEPHPCDPELMKPVAAPYHTETLSIVTRAEIKYALDERRRALLRPKPVRPSSSSDQPKPVGQVHTPDQPEFVKPKPVGPVLVTADWQPIVRVKKTVSVECALAHVKYPGKPPLHDPPVDDPMTVECALAHIQRLSILSPELPESNSKNLKRRAREDDYFN